MYIYLQNLKLSLTDRGQVLGHAIASFATQTNSQNIFPPEFDTVLFASRIFVWDFGLFELYFHVLTRPC